MCGSGTWSASSIRISSPSVTVERVVDVAGLGVRVVGSRHVPRAEPLRELFHLGPATVVEEIGRVRRGDRPASDERRLDDLDRLVVGADEDVDGHGVVRRGLVAGGGPTRRGTRRRRGSASRRSRPRAAGSRAGGTRRGRSTRSARSGRRRRRAAPRPRGPAQRRHGVPTSLNGSRGCSRPLSARAAARCPPHRWIDGCCAGLEMGSGLASPLVLSMPGNRGRRSGS